MPAETTLALVRFVFDDEDMNKHYQTSYLTISRSGNHDITTDRRDACVLYVDKAKELAQTYNSDPKGCSIQFPVGAVKSPAPQMGHFVVEVFQLMSTLFQ